MINRRLLIGGKKKITAYPAILRVGFAYHSSSHSYFLGYSVDKPILSSTGQGNVSPNPLANGQTIKNIYTYYYTSSHQSNAFHGQIITDVPVTINGVYCINGSIHKDVAQFLKDNAGKTIPIIFHFD